MGEYVGLDVSQKETSICVVDSDGQIVAEGKVASEPATIAAFLAKQAPAAVRVGLESGALSEWLHDGLQASGVPVICLDARQAHAKLSGTKLNKTDRNDARGLAQLVRTGWYQEVCIKSASARRMRGLLASRGLLIATRMNLENQIRGLLKGAGLLLGKPGRQGFASRAAALSAEVPHLAELIGPLLAVRETLIRQLAILDKALRAEARQDAVVRRCMTMPGVGAVTALAFRTVIDEPTRFAGSRTVGAYLGLTPRRYSSGEIDYSGRISKCGDRWLRSYLFEAATVLLSRVSRWCALKAWAVRLAKRIGLKKAKVALARKMAVILHRMWIDSTDFRWTTAN
jgi:transposase